MNGSAAMSYPAKQGPPTVIYVTTTPQPAPPVIAPANTKWRNKPQTNATAAGGMIFLSGGMNMALSVGWSQYSSFGGMEHFCYSWFIAVIIGTILSMPLRQLIPKKFVMATSAVLILIGGILFTSHPNSYDALLAGRYLNGIAIGLAIVPFLMNASEIADDSYRGSCLAVEQYSMSFGMAIKMMYATYWNITLDFPVNRLHGIFDIVFAVMTMASSLVYFIESPLEHIRKGNEAAALDCLVRLRKPQVLTTETTALLEQQKAYVREEERLTVEQSLGQGFWPLLKLLIVRSLILPFCFSMPLNVALQYSMGRTGSQWAPTVSGILRIAGSFIATFLVDKISRKLPSLLPVACIGGFLVALGSQFQYLSNISNYDDMATALYLYMALQLFAGLYAPYTSIYMAQAFPLLVKPYLMDVVVIVEQLIHIIFITTIRIYVGDSLMAQGIIMLVAFVLLCLTLPETRNTSLAEAQRRFRQLLNLGVN